MKRKIFSLPLWLFTQLAICGSPNVLLICVDDLRPELGCYGVDYIHSPNIDALASEGILFNRHYVQAPTCGASRFALLTGTYGPADNYALFKRAEKLRSAPGSVHPSLPSWFRQHGYETVSIGKVSHHPGGWGGEDWDDLSQPEMPDSWDQTILPVGSWQHPRGAMHGLANGEIRTNPAEMAVYQSFDGPDTAYPDGLITEAALQQMERLAKEGDPFFLAVGLIRPHLPFGAPARFLEPYKNVELPPIPHPEKPLGPSTWHKSSEFFQYNSWGRDPREDDAFAAVVRRHYAACVSYADAQVGRLLDKLSGLGLEKNTVVILWGDHGWHLGEYAVWGKHTLFEESLRSPLIIRLNNLLAAGSSTDAVVETIDIFPTLCQLAELPQPDYLAGTSLVPQFADSGLSDGFAIAYHRKATTIRTSTHRLILHSSGAVELYDHTSTETETRNIAATEPALVSELTSKLKDRLGPGASLRN